MCIQCWESTRDLLSLYLTRHRHVEDASRDMFLRAMINNASEIVMLLKYILKLVPPPPPPGHRILDYCHYQYIGYKVLRNSDYSYMEIVVAGGGGYGSSIRDYLVYNILRGAKLS